MKAAGRAAKGKGALPPQIWKMQHSQQPTWQEFDRMPYREIVTMTALHNVYTAVGLFVAGKATGDVMIYYARLVGDGIVGKDI